MEGIVAIVIIYGGLALIGWFFEQIGKWNKERKSNIRDDVANSVLPKTDITKDLIQEYKDKLANIGYKNQGDGWFYKYYLSDGMKTAMDFVGGSCPSCKEGHLRVIKGEYGKFLGCSNYPKCRHTKSLKTAKKESKDKSIKVFRKLFNLAYN